MHEAPLTVLEEACGHPVVAIASRWRGEHAVDFDRDAVRVFAELFDALGDDGVPSRLGLFLLGRGGRPSFADGLVRLLRGFDVEFTCFVPRVVDGAYTLVALAADDVAVHPYGGLGAFDAPPVRRLGGRLDLQTLPALETLAPDLEIDAEQRPELAETAYFQRLARRQFERLSADGDERADSRIADALGVERLGRQLALSAPELQELGLPARPARGDEREAMWRLQEAIEATLELRGPRPERYTESDIAEEVEFEPAEWVPGGLVESAARAVVYELDTGSPDPDTNMLDGAWARTDDS